MAKCNQLTPQRVNSVYPHLRARCVHQTVRLFCSSGTISLPRPLHVQPMTHYRFIKEATEILGWHGSRQWALHRDAHGLCVSMGSVGYVESIVFRHNYTHHLFIIKLRSPESNAENLHINSSYRFIFGYHGWNRRYSDSTVLFSAV